MSQIDTLVAGYVVHLNYCGVWGPREHAECTCGRDGAIEKVRAALTEREERLTAFEEREAACCPEDVGFDEYIRSLEKKLAEREERIAAQETELGMFRSSVTAMRAQLDEFVRAERASEERIAAQAKEIEALRALYDHYSDKPSPLDGSYEQWQDDWTDLLAVTGRLPNGEWKP